MSGGEVRPDGRVGLGQCFLVGHPPGRAVMQVWHAGDEAAVLVAPEDVYLVPVPLLLHLALLRSYPKKPFLAGMVHDAEPGRITRLCDVCPTGCPEQQNFSGRNGGRPSICEPDELPDLPPRAIGEEFVAGRHAGTSAAAIRPRTGTPQSTPAPRSTPSYNRSSRGGLDVVLRRRGSHGARPLRGAFGALRVGLGEGSWPSEKGARCER